MTTNTTFKDSFNKIPSFIVQNKIEKKRSDLICENRNRDNKYEATYPSIHPNNHNPKSKNKAFKCNPITIMSESNPVTSCGR
jgi:hypothetical protein